MAAIEDVHEIRRTQFRRLSTGGGREAEETHLSSGRRNKLAGQIGEYLVCAELARRGYIATPFSGNVPTFDVLATDEQCRTVPIQVKASTGDNWRSVASDWMEIEYDYYITGHQRLTGQRTIENPDLIHVCVAIALPDHGRDRFFILTHAELQQACITSYCNWMQERNWRRPRSPQSLECRYGIHAIQQYEDNWKLITDRLQTSDPDPTLNNEGS